jgi:hypothetical protein
MYKKTTRRPVNKYRNIKHRLYGSVAFPGRSELEEHFPEVPLTSDMAEDSLRGPGKWSVPLPRLPIHRKKTKIMGAAPE